jgi:hypothetical protein
MVRIIEFHPIIYSHQTRKKMQTRTKTTSGPKYVFIAKSHTDTNPQRYELNKDGSVDVDKIEQQFDIEDSWFELFGKKGSMVPSSFLTPDKKYVICGKKKSKPISQVSQLCRNIL